MKKKYILAFVLTVACSITLAAQDGNSDVYEPEKKLIDTGASMPLALEEMTSAVSVIGPGSLEHRNSKNIGNSLLGQGLGLISLQGAGTYAEQNPTFYIRGLQTLNGNDSPLILVDGIERDITNLSAEEVDYIVVLKDAAAVALYGYKGINGAVQIVTKRGEYNTQEVKVHYDHQFNSLINKPKFVDAYTYGLALNEARINDGLTAAYSDNELAALRDGTYPYLYPNVNWVDETFRNTASTDNLSVEFRGGETNFRYYAMLDLISDRGFIRNHNLNDGYSTQDKYVRGNLRLNLDIDLTRTTDVSVNVLGVLLENSGPGGLDSSYDSVDLWEMVYTVPSAAFPITDADGVWAGSNTWAGTSNPVAQSTGAAYYKYHTRALYADLTIKQDISPLVEGLGAFMKVGYDSTADIYEDHSMTYVYTVTVPTWTTGASEPTSTTSTYGEDTTMGDGANTYAFIQRAHFDIGLTYDRTFGKHAFNTQFKWDYEYYNIEGVNTTVYRQNYSLWGHYGYAGKYLVDLALVESGSSRLAPGTKWNFSPTVSFAWVMSKEDFLKSSGWVNFLKLRASAGLLNADYLPGSSVWTYYVQQYETSGTVYPFNSSFASEFGSTYLGSLATTDPRHEKALKFNVGVDGRLFKGLTFSVDGYYQRRSDIWVDASGRYSAVIGQDAPYESEGIVDSWGTEIGLDYNARIGDVAINVGGNFNFNRSKIIEMLEEPRLYSNLVQTGNRVDQFYGLQAIGFFRDEDDIANSPTQNFTSVQPGDIKYADINGDGVIDENDVVALGYGTSVPEIYYNFHLGAEWKGLGFYLLFQGAANYSAYLNTQSMYFPLVSNTTISQYYYDNRWASAEDTDTAKFPRLSSQSNTNNYRANSLFLANRSFLKLRNAEVYYNFPERLLSKTKFVKGAKFYVQGNDLFSLDCLDVSDPEAYGTAQLYRSVVLGLRFTF